MRKIIIPIGQKFNRLTILREVEKKGYNRRVETQCECGTIKIQNVYRVIKGEIVSCGCYGKEIARKSIYELKEKTNGKYDWKKGNKPFNYVDGDNSKINKNENHYLTRVWQGIKQRCYNPNEPGYKWYGARGIEMYKPWINDYQLFKKYILENLGHRPEGYSLDRIDNDFHYYPDNLRWADQETQTKNRRNVRHKS